jgi:hypothetical protein
LGIAVIDQHIWRCGVSRIGNPTYIWRCVTENPREPTIEEHFSKVTDPRKDRTKDHKIINIIAIAICAIICGAERWTDMENYGNSKVLWLKTFLELPNGIPSHDTFGQVFGKIDAQQFQLALWEWLWAVNDIVQGQIVNIDRWKVLARFR